MPGLTPTSIRNGSFRFEVATSADEPALRSFSRSVDMPGAVRFSFEREPDYFGALCVEGRQSEVLVCRETGTGHVRATGHRSIKPVFVNGQPMPVGYLSGLRLEEPVRNGRILGRGYQFLRERHADGRALFYLTTIMEGNRHAKAALLSGRCGLPQYHDFGRFCCMAISLNSRGAARVNADLRVRNAEASDASTIVAFLQSEGRSRQFFPEYQVADFGTAGSLLSHLKWDDVFLGFRGHELVGVVAAWDQRVIRCWRVTGYANWLRVLRQPFNLLARLRRMPRLPKPGSTPDYFILSLVCIRSSDRAAFAALLDEMVRQKRRQYAFFLAGLHERDPLLPELLARPHFPLPSRLYVAAWEDGEAAVQKLDRGLVPYLELGSL